MINRQNLSTSPLITTLGVWCKIDTELLQGNIMTTFSSTLDCTNDECQEHDGWIVRFLDDCNTLELTCSYCNRSLAFPIGLKRDLSYLKATANTIG